MYRLAIAAIVVAIVVALIVLLSRNLLGVVEADTGRSGATNGGAMSKIAFFLLLCVMAYAISTGAT